MSVSADMASTLARPTSRGMSGAFRANSRSAKAARGVELPASLPCGQAAIERDERFGTGCMQAPVL